LEGSGKPGWFYIKWYTSAIRLCCLCLYIGRNRLENYLVAIKLTGLEANADKTKYMVMFRDLNAGRSHNIKPDNSAFEKIEGFKY